MSNGELLLTLKQYAESGKPIADDLFKALTLSALSDQAVSSKLFEDKIEDKIDCLEKKIVHEKGVPCNLAENNKDEVDRLRNRNNVTDTVTLILISVGTFLGITEGP